MASRTPAGAAVLRESVTTAIRDAVFEELAASGYGRLSMEAVARRAGVGKAALYRRWRSKEAMLIDLVSQVVRAQLPAADDTGSLRGDLEHFHRATLTALNHPLARAVLPELVSEAARNPSLADALREVVAAPRRESSLALLNRAVARGELPADLDSELALDLMGSPLFFRLLITGAPADEAYLARLANATVAALKAAADGT